MWGCCATPKFTSICGIGYKVIRLICLHYILKAYYHLGRHSARYPYFYYPY
jgi:hypothetical protein